MRNLIVFLLALVLFGCVGTNKNIFCNLMSLDRQTIDDIFCVCRDGKTGKVIYFYNLPLENPQCTPLKINVGDNK